MQTIPPKEKFIDSAFTATGRRAQSSAPLIAPD
jgi:hypothetical protein